MVKRGGFTLVEVIVAISLLTLAVLTFAASVTVAAAMLRSAGREEAAARLAASLLDSLLLEPAPGSGSVRNGDLTAEWSGAAGGHVTLSVSYEEAGRRQRHTWSGQSLSALGRLSERPEP
jgi:type II secretory pathway pseudopilin PulG